MTKVLYVPLDDRDCNYEFPYRLSLMTEGIELLRPPYAWMGFLKKPADREKIWEWLLEHAAECEYAILSVDTLVYGNIIGSRIHHRSAAACEATLEKFRELKKINPKLHIHAFNLAARVAAYNDAHEDPDYWEEHGYQIWRYTYLCDKETRSEITEEERREMVELKACIPEEILEDFLERRSVDRMVNLTAVELVKEGVFDILTVPKDDTAEFGYAAMDQNAIAEKVVKERVMDRVYCYPGADEAGSVIFSRVFCEIKHYCPAVYVRYSSLSGPMVIPRYEDRPLGESIKWQITSAGGVYTETPADADCMLAVNAPGKYQIECAKQDTKKDISFRNFANTKELLNYVDYYRRVYDKAIGIADVTTTNGCDNEFMESALLHQTFEKIQAIGGWNTAENTIGVVLAQTIIASFYRCYRTEAELKRRADAFLVRSITADWLCQANVLQHFLKEYAVENGINPYFLREREPETKEYFEQGLKNLLEEKLKGQCKGRRIEFERIRFNWNGAYYFAVDVDLK